MEYNYTKLLFVRKTYKIVPEPPGPANYSCLIPGCQQVRQFTAFPKRSHCGNQEINACQPKIFPPGYIFAIHVAGFPLPLQNPIGAGGNHPNATTGPDISFFDLDLEAIRKVLDLNLTGTILPSQIFGRYMAEKGEGIILNVSSMNAFRPLTKVPAYSAAKAAVSNFTQWLAVHLAQEYSQQIRVNAIAPGFFLTEQNRFLLTDKDSGELTPRGETIRAHTPMDRFGQPEDLIGAVLWLLSPASKFVTGIVVPVDGGFSAYSGV